MRIGLNAHLLSFGETYRGAGISRYIRNLISQLLITEGGHEFTVFLGDKNLPTDWRNASNLHPVISQLPTVKPIVRIAWEQLLQPIETVRHKFDVFHYMGYVQPMVCPHPSVVTVYDLSFLVHPEAFNRPNRLYLSSFTRRSVHQANRIIAISQHTKNDLISLLQVPEEKIDVIYPGVEDHFSVIPDRSQLETFRRKHDLPEHFVLFFGTLEPRKGADILMEAWAMLKKETDLPHCLVLGGAKGWLYDSIFDRVKELGLEESVQFVGYVRQEEQPLWYNCADLFVYPSLYEGFGFPPLEAMACGTPVITSRVSSLPEVVGDAALLVEPGDAIGLFNAMSTALSDQGRMRQMSETGLTRAKTFSWQQAAYKTLATYQAAGENS